MALEFIFDMFVSLWAEWRLFRKVSKLWWLFSKENRFLRNNDITRIPSGDKTIRIWRRGDSWKPGCILDLRGDDRSSVSDHEGKRLQQSFPSSPAKSIRLASRELRVPCVNVHKTLHDFEVRCVQGSRTVLPWDSGWTLRTHCTTKERTNALRWYSRTADSLYHRVRVTISIWGTALQAGKSWIRFADGVIEIFYWFHPSDRTMALRSTQLRTDMTIRDISWEVKAAGE